MPNRLVVNARAHESRTRVRPTCRSRSSSERFSPDVRRVPARPTAHDHQAVADRVRRHQRRGHHKAIDGGEVGFMHPQRQAPGQFERDRSDPEPGDHRLPRQPERPCSARASPARSSGTRGLATAWTARSEGLPDQEPDRLLHRPLRLAGRSRLPRGPGGQRRVRRDEHDDEQGIREALSRTAGRCPDPVRVSQLRPGQQDVHRTRRATRICPSATSSGWPTTRAGSAIQPAPNSRWRCRRSSRARRSSEA